MLALLLTVGLAQGATLRAPLTDVALVAAIREFQLHAHYSLPLPDAKRRAQLIDGKLVKMRLPSADGEPVGALAMVVSDLSKAELWVGSADGDMGDPPDEVISHDLPLLGGEMFRWYGYVRLPAPITDRHFLIQTTVNRPLEKETNGRMWSRHWAMEPGGLDTARELVAQGAVKGVSMDRFDAAVWVPHNTGAWLFLDLPDGRTLLGYQATASLGGGFPDGLVSRTLYWGLERLMSEVVGQAHQARAHYRVGHAPIIAGDGLPLPVFE